MQKSKPPENKPSRPNANPANHSNEAQTQRFEPSKRDFEDDVPVQIPNQRKGIKTRDQQGHELATLIS